jgi:repressor LexA
VVDVLAVDHEPLTAAQAELLATIRERANRGESAPSYRDLCAEFGWASTGTARDHLQALARKGYITLGGGRARQVRLVDSPAAVARVRVLGRVVAGQPEAAVEVPDGEIAVPAAWLGRGRFFALCVAGESMRNAAIIDGDTVVVREQSTAADGEIVVATVAGETTVKRLQLSARGVRLLPENPDFAPIDVHDGDVTIHGVVVAVMRSLATRAPARPMKGRTSSDHRQPERTRHG